ncbi:glycoside hydrolase family 140 protein [Spirosoma fluviale]|uniref:Collagen-binding domain of a collagenase n=1 Tax=Spirosoma fluviale TaxID=1597977 RepID=A0A286G9D0_9BACT|nr:glycoside hydrolase family 140 protein [Spirosoma fluviale]SOD91709.1 Putative collagen-binding domain of a collagenase [Spirosoma fluviale]
MKNTFLLLLLIFTQTLVLAQQPFSGGRLKVSDNKRYLVHQDGSPFFWLGDTAWELFHRLNREEADQYLKRRAEQGFTVVQAVALAEFDGLKEPNPYGEVPLVDNDPTKPNEAYFKHVDFIIDKAAQYGIVVAFLPTWGDKVFKSSWGQGPEIFNPANAKVYGRYLGNRYKNRENIVWVLGGDRQPRDGSSDVELWRAMATGIQEAVGGADKALMTYHPQPNGLDGGASKWFKNDAWFDFNMHQNGHCRNNSPYDNITVSYNNQPVKPTMDAEPIYEDHPVCFNAKDLGTSNAYDVRLYAYLDLFAGAHGHTYGCHDIWQMYSAKRPAVNNPHIFWQEALDLPGANQMKHVRRLMTARPLLARIPDQSLIVENNLGPAERIQATRGADYAFVYSAAGKPFTVNPGKISGKSITATWFDPRSGKTQSAGSFDNQKPMQFKPPTQGYGQDWILVLDDATKNYAAL